jgi:hypothetical protein
MIMQKYCLYIQKYPDAEYCANNIFLQYAHISYDYDVVFYT